MNQRKEIIDDTDFFVYSIIGEEKWEKLSATKKLYILKKYSEIQDLVNANYFS